LNRFIVENVLSHTYVFQTSSAFLVRNISVCEICYCLLASRSSISTISDTVSTVHFYKKMLCGWAINLARGPRWEGRV